MPWPLARVVLALGLIGVWLAGIQSVSQIPPSPPVSAAGSLYGPYYNVPAANLVDPRQPGSVDAAFTEQVFRVLSQATPTPPPTRTPTPTFTPTPLVCTPITRFGERFDGVTAPALPIGWTATETGPAPLWVTSNAGNPTPAADSAPNAAFVDDPNTTSDKRLDSPSIVLTTSHAQLTFRQNYGLELTYDGGVLEISINGGAFSDIITAGGSFVGGGGAAAF
ncbi:MAG TPA: hypothetical protein VII06_28380 [Chloroflexota bacterium]|jgi:hypothetical protein